MFDFPFHPFIPPLFVAALTGVIITLFAWRQRTLVGTAFGLLSLATAHYAATYMCELFSSSLSGMLFWVDLEYAGIVAIPVLLFLFTLAYTRRDLWIDRRSIGLLSIVPAGILLLVWTNGQHMLFYTRTAVVSPFGFPQLDVSPGIGYWINILYGYGLVLASLALLAIHFHETSSPARRQVGFVLAGALVPWVADILYLTLILRDRPGVDLAPVTFALSAAIIAVTIFRHRLLTVLPVARSQLVEAMDDGWIMLDSHHRFIDLNDLAQNILGIERRHVIGQPADSVVGQEHPLLIFLTMAEEGQRELMLEVGDESTRTYDTRLSFLRGRGGLITGRLLILHDITKRRNAEHALRALNQDLEQTISERTAEIRAEKDTIEAILRTVNEGIILTDADLVIRYANAFMEELVETDPASLLGQSMESIPIWEPDRVHVRVVETIRRQEVWQSEVHLQQANGRIITCELFAAPVNARSERISGYIITFRDITPLRKLANARNQFISNISHELRTPLTTLRLYLDLLDRRGFSEKSPHYNRYMDVLTQQVGRMERLSQSVVDLAKLDSSQGITSWRPLELSALIATAIAEHEKLIQSHQVQVVVEQPQAPTGGVSGDPDRIRQAIGEVLHNAINFATPGSEIHLAVSRHDEDGRAWAKIAVRDRGPGIPEEERERVFERFYRGVLTAEKNIPGFGLGLSIVNGIMAEHGGKTTIDAAEDGGSIVTLWLPVGGNGVDQPIVP